MIFRHKIWSRDA